LGWNTDCQHSFITFGEMFIFPFSNSFVKQGSKGHEGRYMALFTMSFSLAHIASSKTGLTIIDAYGYQTNWFVMGSLGFSASCIWLQNSSKRKRLFHSNSLGVPPLLKGQTNELATEPFQQCGRLYAPLADCCYPSRGLISRTTICIKDLQLPKSAPKKSQTD
jgi:hypothetical protein